MHRRHVLLLALLGGVSACRDGAPLTPAVPDQPPHALADGVTTDLRAGTDYVCLLRGGSVTCFGSADQGQPVGVHRAATGAFVELSAGATHACALRDDGAVECWGSNAFGEAPALVRAAAGSFTSVSAGLSHTCAVRTDGRLECWGSNANGQAPPVVAAQAGTFTEVTASASRTCALRTDGVVECRGYREGSPTVKAGSYKTLGPTVGATICLLRNDGMLECFGSQPSFYTGPYAQIGVGAAHVCALHPEGRAECSGYTYAWEGPGRRGATAGTWTRITAGSYHTCGLRADGYFECFGVQSIGSNAPDVVPAADAPASSLDAGRIRVDWRDVNSNELRTEVERSVADDDGHPAAWTPAGTLGADRVGLVDSLATAGATYLYRIRVCNDAGCSDWALSNPTRYPASAPPAPTVTAHGYTCGFESCARVAWTADNTFVDAFRVQRRTNPGPGWGEWETVAERGRETTTFDDYALTPKARYRYRVAACNLHGCSAWAESAPLVAPAPPRPAAPASLSAAMIGFYMSVVWGDVVNETTYELQRRQSSGTGYGAWSDPVVRTMNVTSDEQVVVQGTLYQWRIRACNRSGCSEYTYSAPTQA